ncbi:MAG: TrkA family potassium uptake protein [Clostridiales bacterium]|nr:TrkA family potassium uptake protein [Clostridiales bacterium]
MFRNQKNEAISYGIIGLGRFGSALALELARSGAELLVIDKEEEKVREMREYTENAFVVKNLDKKSLLETGIKNCDIVIVCIGERLDTSVLTTLNLVSLGVPQVIAKANSADHGDILEKLGAEVVYPERDMAIRLANRLETSNVLDSIHMSEQLDISKLPVPDCMVGKSVVDIDLRSRFMLNIIAVVNNEAVMQNVDPQYVFRKNDILFLCGSRDGIMRLSEWTEKQA